MIKCKLCMHKVYNYIDIKLLFIINKKIIIYFLIYHVVIRPS